MTSGNRIIVLCFGVITASQLGIGLYVAADAVENGCESVTKYAHGSYLPYCFSVTGHTDPASGLYRVHLQCKGIHSNRIRRHVSRIWYVVSFVVQTSTDHLEDTRSDHLPDFLAFSVIVSLVIRSGLRGVPIPSIFKTITRDATYYFLVIFSSHLLLVIFLALEKVSTSS